MADRNELYLKHIDGYLERIAKALEKLASENKVKDVTFDKDGMKLVWSESCSTGVVTPNGNKPIVDISNVARTQEEFNEILREGIKGGDAIR